MKEQIETIDKIIKDKNKKNLDKVIEDHLIKIKFYQHERLVHFLVTMLFAIMFLMTFLSIPGNEGYKTAFIKVESDFKKKIIPGDRLDIESKLESFRRGLAIGNSIGKVNGEVACAAKFVIAIPDIMRQFNPNKNKIGDKKWLD